MSLDLFEGVAQSCVEMGFENLNLTSVGGEILTHPNAVTIIEKAKHLGFRSIALHTNGILLYRHDMEALLTSGLSALFISTPGFSDELYKSIFGVNKFNEFRKSVGLLLATHARINSQVEIHFCPRTYLTKQQIQNSDFFVDTISQYIKNSVCLDEPLTVFDSWGGEIKETDFPSGMKVDVRPIKSIYPLKKLNLCSMLEQINVLSNGDVRLCNCRYDRTINSAEDPLLIDNLAQHKNLKELMEVNKSKVKNIKDGFINGQLSDLCRTCSVYRPIKNELADDPGT